MLRGGMTEIGHFTQPDTVVPGAMDALAWDRYAYVQYNPMKYIDPSGNRPICGLPGGDCSNSFEETYNVTFDQHSHGGNLTKPMIVAIKAAVMAVGQALGVVMNMDGAAAFSLIFGGLDFSFGAVSDGMGWAYGDDQILFDSIYFNPSSAERLVVHEIGHIFDRRLGASVYGSDWLNGENLWSPLTARGQLSTDISGDLYDLFRPGYKDPDGSYYGFAGGQGVWQFGAIEGGVAETWADMFVGWVYNTWETDSAGELTTLGSGRSSYMNGVMGEYTQLISKHMNYISRVENGRR